MELNKNIYKITLIILLLSILFVLTIYALSEHKLTQVVIPPPFNANIKTDEETVDHGKHLLKTRGCFGCHGRNLEGRVRTDWEWVKKAVTPNLAILAKNYDAVIIERAIRHGIDHNERIMWSMPSYNFKHLSDDDINAIIAYLLQAEPVAKELGEPEMGFKARWQLITGEAEHMVDWVARVPDLKIDPQTNPDLARGEYIAMTTCNECHGLDLRGYDDDGWSIPDLSLIIKAFDEVKFRRLMKNGIGLGGRKDLGLMSMVAKDRFAYFTEQELNDLYNYLISLGH